MIRHSCACGRVAAFVEWRANLWLCDGCNFRLTVMREAGRMQEFVDDYRARINAYQYSIKFVNSKTGEVSVP